MRKLLLLALVGASLLTSCKNYYLRGYYTRDEFIRECRWKHPVAEKYQPKPPYGDSLRLVRDSFDVKLFLGTWCSDSRKWVPRFFQLQPMLPVRRLEIISVDTTKKDERKLCAAYKIDSLPTFVFLRQGQIGSRLVEKPYKRKLEKELYRILK